ncbi:MAG: hypothetical protein HOO88_03360 [Kiritimatiellaceae bacterium]|nr:hypothetical protein [Kiritimatiellaceae bacterium]
MKRFLFVCILWCGLAAVDAASIWQENFSSYTGAGVTGLGPTNYPAGITNWSLNAGVCATLNPGSGSAGDYFMATSTSGGRLEAVNVDGEAVWSSAVIHIADCANVSLSAIASETGSSVSTNKYVKLFYRLDGGAETAFTVNPANVGNWGSAAAVQSNLCGTTVQIIARMNNPNVSDKSILDDVIVSGDRVAVPPPPASDCSRIAGFFYGWSGDTIFKLAGGQFWQQSTAGTRAVSPALRQPYVTITNVSGQRRMIVTNVTGYVVVAPLTVTESAVTNTFAGLHYQNLYQLADGTAWKQISFETVSSAASPVTVWRWIKDGQQMLRFLNRDNAVIGTCTGEAVVPATDTKTHSKIAGNFYGFGHGNLFRLADGSWRKQISFERSDSVRSNPDVLVWNEDGADFLEMPDEARRVTVEKLAVQLESTVTNTFTGLHHGNLYRLANGEKWMQLSFENISTNVISPNIMLWSDETKTNLLLRDSRDVTIGICTVADPNADSDNDGLSDAAEILAGADPLDSESRFELRQTGRNVLSWNAVEGRVYTIEWSPSLTEIFQTLENNIIWPQNSWTDTVHSAETKGYYRITVRRAE